MWTRIMSTKKKDIRDVMKSFDERNKEKAREKQKRLKNGKLCSL